MNVYLITEDGESFCVKAETMSEAVNFCETRYLEELRSDEHHVFHLEYDVRFYHDQILQSCQLIGELRN